MCCKRNRTLCRTRSITIGDANSLSQFPRTTVTGGPNNRSSSSSVGVQTSPRCQISSTSLTKAETFAGKRLCVSAMTNTFVMSSEYASPIRTETSLISLPSELEILRSSASLRSSDKAKVHSCIGLE